MDPDRTPGPLLRRTISAGWISRPGLRSTSRPAPTAMPVPPTPLCWLRDRRRRPAAGRGRAPWQPAVLERHALGVQAPPLPCDRRHGDLGRLERRLRPRHLELCHLDFPMLPTTTLSTSWRRPPPPACRRISTLPPRHAGGDLKKVKAGKALIKLFCLPGVDRHAAEPPGRVAGLPALCQRRHRRDARDLPATRQLPLAEWREYWAMEAINDRGIAIDKRMVEHAATPGRERPYPLAPGAGAADRGRRSPPSTRSPG